MFELNNEQRACFGLDPVQKSWERVEFAGDRFRPASVLYFEGDVIKKHAVSTDEHYWENGYDEATRGTRNAATQNRERQGDEANARKF